MNLTYVEGASPDKWLRVWRERHRAHPMHAVRVPETEQWDALTGGTADLAIVRLNDAAALAEAQQRGFAVELYRERSVVVLPREHPYADAETLNLADIDDIERTPAQSTVEDTLAVTAAGVGACVLPMSVARLFHRRDLVSIELTDGPEYPVALAWHVDSAEAQDFVGITRGRGARSSRA